jgi:hypothetical protein
MRKSTIFISAVLTTFALAILYSLVYAYRSGTATAATAATSPTIAPIATDVPVATVETPTTVTPVQAAQLAAQVLGHNDLLSAESANLNGVDGYKISFQSGDVVYVSLDGQILSIQTVPQVVVVPAQTQAVKHKSNNNNNNSNNSGGEHEHESGD